MNLAFENLDLGFRDIFSGERSTYSKIVEPVRMLASVGAICSGNNIFMFFPEVIGLNANSEKGCFGLERTIFLAAIFHEIGHRTGHFKVSPATPWY
jgi:hypothetical protein